MKINYKFCNVSGLFNFIVKKKTSIFNLTEVSGNKSKQFPVRILYLIKNVHSQYQLTIFDVIVTQKQITVHEICLQNICLHTLSISR